MDSISNEDDAHGSGNSSPAATAAASSDAKEQRRSSMMAKKTSDEDEAPLKVRDMINLYNFATEKKKELAEAKPIFLKARKATRQSQTLSTNSNGESLVDDSATCSPVLPFDCTASGSNEHGNSMPALNNEHFLEQSAMATSFQSKTSIIKTKEGARVIIDIFSDKQCDSDSSEDTDASSTMLSRNSI